MRKRKLVKTLCFDCKGSGYEERRAYPANPQKFVKVKCRVCRGRGYVLEEPWQFPKTKSW